MTPWPVSAMRHCAQRRNLMKSSSRLIFFSLAALVIVQQAEDEVVSVLAAKIGIWRIAKDDEDGAVAFDGGGFVGFLGQRGEWPSLVRDVFDAFERVGKENIDALIALEMIRPGVAPEFGQMASAQFQANLEMRYGIRSHEQLKSEEARQQMLVNIGGPESGLMFFLESFADLFDDFKQKSAGAGGRVEDQHAVGFFLDVLTTDLVLESEFGFVGEAVLQAEFVTQQPVNALDDVGDDRFRRVINAAQFTKFRIVSRKKGFVEVDDRIAPPAGFNTSAEILQNHRHVGAFENGDEVLHETNEGFVVELWPGDEFKKVAEKRIGLRNLLGRFRERELAGRTGHDTGGKQTVSQRLREHVSKLGLLAFVGEFGQKRLREHRAPVPEHFRGISGLECGGDAVANQMREPREPVGQFLRAFEANRVAREKFLENFFSVRDGGGVGNDFAVGLHLAQPELRAFRTVHKPAEFDIVREQQVCERGQVAFELVGFFRLVERDTNVLGLDIANQQTVLFVIDGQVGCAAFDPLGFVGGDDAWIERFQQRLEGGTMRVFGVVAD